jgi:hypothetical protein
MRSLQIKASPGAFKPFLVFTKLFTMIDALSFRSFMVYLLDAFTFLVILLSSLVPILFTKVLSTPSHAYKIGFERKLF